MPESEYKENLQIKIDENKIYILIIPSFNWDFDKDNNEEDQKIEREYLTSQSFFTLAMDAIRSKQRKKMRAYKERIQKIKTELKIKNSHSLFLIQNINFLNKKWAKDLFNELFPDTFQSFHTFYFQKLENEKIEWKDKSYSPEYFWTISPFIRGKINVLILHYEDRYILKEFFPKILGKEMIFPNMPLFILGNKE